VVAEEDTVVDLGLVDVIRKCASCGFVSVDTTS
jgi:hypothetical protein